MPPQTEAGFLRTVLELAARLGWRCLHLRPARTARGWRTPLQGQGVGWPDVFAVRGPRMVAAELKVGRRKTTPEQEAWLACLAAAGVETHTLYPDDFDEIVEIFR